MWRRTLVTLRTRGRRPAERKPGSEAVGPIGVVMWSAQLVARCVTAAGAGAGTVGVGAAVDAGAAPAIGGMTGRVIGGGPAVRLGGRVGHDAW